MVALVPDGELMLIDLHTHTTASDGTSSPTELVREAVAAGVAVLGIADHDTASGWDEASAAAAGSGLQLVRGIEVSTRWAGMSVHLLAYLLDPESEGIAAAMGATRRSRWRRAETMVSLIASDYPITWEQVVAIAGEGAVIGRPHIADALVAAGVVPDRDTAFSQLLHAAGRYHVPHDAPGTAEAISLVVAAGGVPVLAHPGAIGRGRTLPDDTFAELTDAGLFGIEVFHRDHSPEQRARLTELAARHGLAILGSSDYHGTGKLNRLAENTTEPDVLAAIVEAGTLEVVA